MQLKGHVVAIIGGAVSGSEAARWVLEQGGTPVVIEQNRRPYGKIEEGLPRWHVKLRRQEYESIDARLSEAGVVYVPLTRLGGELEWATLTEELGFSAVILANGAAWDRRLPAAIDAYEGKGLVYQNPFVQAFNWAHGDAEALAQLPIKDGALVIGGGLASIDCVKVLNFELYRRALAERGHEVDVERMDQDGLPKILEGLGLTAEELGIQGATLVYRRRAEDMPLVPVRDTSPERMKRYEAARLKILNKFLEKYLARFEPLLVPEAPLVEDGALVGVRFERQQVVEGALVGTGESVALKSPLVVSSIGSIPEALPGVAVDGEYYPWMSWDTGLLVEEPTPVFGLGNVLTGRGNILASRRNAKEVMEAAWEVIAARPTPDEATQGRLREWIAARWEAAGYRGEYAAWIAEDRPSI